MKIFKIKKIIAHTIAIPVLIVITILNVFIAISKLPKIYLSVIKGDFKHCLHIMPYTFRQYFEYFDCLGYRHHKEFLENINVSDFIFLDTKELAKYAHVELVKISKKLPNFDIAVPEFEAFEKMENIHKVTMIGDLAYLALHGNNEKHVIAINALNNLKQKYK